MFALGIISDEIEQDFDQACQLIRDWGIEHVELRTMWGKNILELEESELDQVGEITAKYELNVTAIASPVFKSPRDGIPKETEGDFQLGGFDSFEDQLELIRKSAALCQRFGTDKIRIFTFWREPWSDDLVQDVAVKLIEAATLAKDMGVTLIVENEPVCVVCTGEELGKLFSMIRQLAPADIRKHIAILWDPGNASHGSEETPYPDGYNMLQADEVVHLHLKDSLVGEGGSRRYVPLGYGDIDYVAQFHKLKVDGYAGLLVLEPHYHPKGMRREDAAKACVKAAKETLREAFPSS